MCTKSDVAMLRLRPRRFRLCGTFRVGKCRIENMPVRSIGAMLMHSIEIRCGHARPKQQSPTREMQRPCAVLFRFLLGRVRRTMPSINIYEFSFLSLPTLVLPNIWEMNPESWEYLTSRVSIWWSSPFSRGGCLFPYRCSKMRGMACKDVVVGRLRRGLQGRIQTRLIDTTPDEGL